MLTVSKLDVFTVGAKKTIQVLNLQRGTNCKPLYMYRIRPFAELCCPDTLSNYKKISVLDKQLLSTGTLLRERKTFQPDSSDDIVFYTMVEQ